MTDGSGRRRNFVMTFSLAKTLDVGDVDSVGLGHSIDVADPSSATGRARPFNCRDSRCCRLDSEDARIFRSHVARLLPVANRARDRKSW